jgi:hypothetical protein
MESNFLLLPITSDETLQKCLNLNVIDTTNTPKTIFLASYPKSGTTWLQCIVHQILSHGDTNLSHISDYSPFYEADRTWENEEYLERYSLNHNRLGARVFNTHLKFEMLPKGESVFYIYVYRNGRDVVHSFFQHLSNQADSGNYEGNFQEFFQDWINCKIPYGSWVQHLKNWINASKDPSTNILLLRYEDLKNDFSNCLQQISQHIQSNCSREELLEVILPHCTFSYMKEHKDQYEPVSVGWKPGFEFIRKGVIGDSDEIFQSEQRQKFEEMIRNEFPEGIPEWIQDYL